MFVCQSVCVGVNCQKKKRKGVIELNLKKRSVHLQIAVFFHTFRMTRTQLFVWTSPPACPGPRGRGATPLAWPGVRIAAERFRTRHTSSLRSRKPTGAEPEAQFDAITKRICVTPLAVKGDVAALLHGTTHRRLVRRTRFSVARKRNKIEFRVIRSRRCTSERNSD